MTSRRSNFLCSICGDTFQEADIEHCVACNKSTCLDCIGTREDLKFVESKCCAVRLCQKEDCFSQVCDDCDAEKCALCVDNECEVVSDCESIFCDDCARTCRECERMSCAEHFDVPKNMCSVCALE